MKGRMLKYAKLVVEARERGWQAHIRPVDIGFVAKSTTTLLLDFGFRERSIKGALKLLSEAAEKASQ